MEVINQELEQKSIERPKGVDFATGEDVIEGGVVNKPKKPRTQAQKEAFERARKKRAENLAKKKELEELTETGDSQGSVSEANITSTITPEKLQSPIQETKPVKRGRPRGSRNKKVMKREPEPQPLPSLPLEPAPIYINNQPPTPNQRYPQQSYQQQFYPPPQQYYQPPPQPQQPVSNNYYYYGTPPPQHSDPQVHPAQTEEDYEVESEESEEEIAYVDTTDYLTPEPDPRLKFRFA